MFRGSHSTRVDEKGRLKLPADFRRDLPEGQVFYITSVDGKRAQLYPMEIWKLKEQALAALPSMHPARQVFEDVTGLYGQTVEMDAQGRLLLPQLLREEAKIAEEVRVFGRLAPIEPGFLEVVNYEMFLAERKAAPLTDEVRMQLAALGV